MKSYEQTLQECRDYEADYYDHLETLLSKDKISEDVFHQVRDTMVREMEIKENGMDKKDMSFGFKSTKSKKPLIAENKKISLVSLDSLPPREYVIQHFGIEKGTLTLLCGTGGSGKTLFLQYLALCVSSGKKLFGKYDVAQGPVLHMDEEQNEEMTLRRYIRIASGLGVADIDINRIRLENRLDSPEEIETVKDDLVEVFKGKKLVLIDSLKKTSQADENSSQIEVILKILRQAAEKANTTIILVHHMGKSTGHAKQTGRGHSSIYDSVDNQIDAEEDKKTGTITLSCAKMRDHKPFGSIVYKFRDIGNRNSKQFCSEGLEFEFVEEKSSDDVKNEIDNETKLLKLLNDKGVCNQTKLFDEVKGERKAFSKLIDSLLEKEFITESKGASNARLFTITPAGSDNLAWSAS